MSLSAFFSLIFSDIPGLAEGIAICAVIALLALVKEIVVPGPRYRAALKETRLWQRLYLTAFRVARTVSQDPAFDLDFDLDHEEPS